MEGWQPADAATLSAQAEAALDLLRVVQQVGVAELDTARLGGGAGGVLEDGQVVRVDARRLPGLRLARLGVGQKPRELPGRCQAGQGGAGGEADGRTRGLGDGLPASRLLARSRLNGDRHGDPAGVQAAKEGGHELQPRRVGQQGALSAPAAVLEERGDPARLPVELGVVDAHGRLLRVAVRQEAERPSVRGLARPPAQHVDEACAHAGRPTTHHSPPGWMEKRAGSWPTSSPSAWQPVGSDEADSTCSSRQRNSSTFGCRMCVPR